MDIKGLLLSLKKKKGVGIYPRQVEITHVVYLLSWVLLWKVIANAMFYMLQSIFPLCETIIVYPVKVFSYGIQLFFTVAVIVFKISSYLVTSTIGSP